MIKKLNKTIFWIIMMLLSIVVVGIIMLSVVLNYQNTISTATSIMEKFSNRQVKMNVNYGKDNIIPSNGFDGIYSVELENSKIIDNPQNTKNKTIKDYAVKISKTNKKSGIIGNYIYKVNETERHTKMITFMENVYAISRARKILIISIVASIISILIIYVIAKKISKLIVKPVEETFEKQKQFVSDASHELKTPLAVIEANTDVLEGEVGENKWIKYIQNEIQNMDQLINELLLLAKIENIDNIKEYKLFNLSDETKIIASTFESLAYEKNVKLKNNITENIMMNGNKEDIEHILSTLIDNAIKHTKPGNDVIIELSKDKNEVIIQVKNQGEKIPEEEREKIFERFYRIDKARNRNEKRYGLGLAIAKGVVEKYHGKIGTDFKDGFTIFKVILPI